MKIANREDSVKTGDQPPPRLALGSWAILIVLFLLLAATFVTTYFGWTLAKGTDIPAAGYVAMVLGVLLSLGVGFGLMALIFYSSRKGYDEPPILISSGGARGDTDTASGNNVKPKARIYGIH